MPGSLRDMRLFVAAFEERSFTAAAQREHATQSGVSQHIRNLETSLGVLLFSRDKGQVVPTPAAHGYYQRCLDVLRAHELATRAVRAYAGGLDGEITVGLMPTMTRCVLAPALADFIGDNPNLVVKIVEGYSATLTQQVRAGDLDFAIVPAFPGVAGLKSRLLLRTPEVLVTAAGTSRRNHAPVVLADQGPLDLVVPGNANTRRATLETYCETNGVKLARILELDAMLGTLDFVARSNWVTILPGIMMAVDDPGGQFKVHPLADPPLTLDLVVIAPSRRPLTPAAEAFLATLEQVSTTLNARWDEAEAPATAPSSTAGTSDHATSPRKAVRTLS